MPFEKTIGTVMTIGGQVPGAVAAFTKYNISIYQPSVYKDYEFLLILPLAVGVFATWFAYKYSAIAMWLLLPTFLALFGVVYWIFENFDTSSRVHTFNWALSYCVLAVFAAMLYRLLADVIP
jgi:hypothetical protein